MVRPAVRPVIGVPVRLVDPLAPSSEGGGLEAPLAPIALRGGSAEPPLGRGGSRPALSLGTTERGRALSLDAGGRIRIDGKLPSDVPGVGADGVVLFEAARILEAEHGLFGALKMNRALRAKVQQNLAAVLDHALAMKPGAARDRATSAAMALSIDLAATTPPSQDAITQAAVTKLVGALSSLSDEAAAFYLLSIRRLLKGRLSQAHQAALLEVQRRVLPAAPPVEEWTQGRTQPLQVRHTLHPEFWKEELAYFSKANGFKLVEKGPKDQWRRYEGTLPDPTGKRPPLLVNLEVRKEELDFLESISDPAVHVILYSGHSSLGGNGSQAIQDAGPMKGPHAKLVLAANCRGKDNYAALTGKYPRAHVITTEHPTYSVSGQARIAALFEMLARGEDYRFMRKQSEAPAWDEPANNYFFPDQWRKFCFMDADGDGKIDHSPLGLDRLWDPELRRASAAFVRGINFLNSELYYHWEVDHEKGKKSYYGEAYADSVIADGASRAVPAGRLVALELAEDKPGQKLFRARFAPGPAKKTEQNLYAGLVSTQAMLALAKHKDGEIKLQEALRAVLMGAHAIHYLDVYTDTNPVTQRAFFSRLGLADDFVAEDVDQIFKKYDANADTAQVEALQKLLSTKYGVDLAAWLPGFLAAHGPVEG